MLYVVLVSKDKHNLCSPTEKIMQKEKVTQDFLHIYLPCVIYLPCCYISILCYVSTLIYLHKKVKYTLCFK